ncbi:MAG: radical SAM protein, partial [Patescibacteria group bacterium]
MKKENGVCLIIPPSVFLLDERVFMSLGILKVAAALKDKFQVEVLDLSGLESFDKVVSDCLNRSDISVFGITATTPQMPAVTKIVETIRKERFGAKIILGGPHATLVNAARKNELKRGINGRGMRAFGQIEKMFDVIVAGDGEKAIFKALESTALKLVDADDSKSELFLNNAGLDDTPFPARQLIDVNSYHYSIDGERALSLIAQLGCPFGCGFCGGRKSPSFRYIRTRSIEKIIEEVELLYKTYGVKGFMFYDDELNLNSRVFVKLMNSLSDLQGRLGVNFKLRGFVRPDLFNEEQAKAMYQSGFRWLLLGFESGSNQMLSNMKKKTTSTKNAVCVEIARKYGLKVKALMSIGHPGESEKSILETHRWLMDVKPEDFDVTAITVYP